MTGSEDAILPARFARGLHAVPSGFGTPSCMPGGKPASGACGGLYFLARAWEAVRAVKAGLQPFRLPALATNTLLARGEGLCALPELPNLLS